MDGLLADGRWRNDTGPTADQRNPDAAFSESSFEIAQWAVVRSAVATVARVKDEQCVGGNAVVLIAVSIWIIQCVDDLTDVLIE